MRWRFEETGFHTGSFNMELDRGLVQSLVEGSGNPTLRVYGWNPAAISLGWSQAIDSVNVRRAADDGLDVVRRPTGGRAVLHSHELTYSVVMISEGKSVSAVYDEISRALVCGLRKLGLDAVMERCQPYFPSEYLKPSSVACFISAARYEIKVNGKKLVGSAQRRYSKGNGEEVVLQHGSVLLGPDHKRIVDYLNVEEDEKTRILALLNAKTADLSTALGRPVQYLEVADVVREGFAETWNLQWEETHEPSYVLSDPS